MRRHLILLLLIPFFGGSAGAQTSDADERKILTEFFASTGGPQWKRKAGWGTSTPICEWEGVVCNLPPNGDRVSWLMLYDNNLRGRLPEALTRLERLTVLSLGSNHLSGRISPKLLDRANSGELNLDLSGSTFAESLVRVSIQVESTTGVCTEDAEQQFAMQIDVAANRATYQIERCTNKRRDTAVYCRRVVRPAPPLDQLSRALARLGFPPATSPQVPGSLSDHGEYLSARLTWGDGRTYRGTRSGGTAAIDEWIAYELLLSIVPSDWERGVKETPCDALRWQ
jgi:hypothetical protein